MQGLSQLVNPLTARGTPLPGGELDPDPDVDMRRWVMHTPDFPFKPPGSPDDGVKTRDTLHERLRAIGVA